MNELWPDPEKPRVVAREIMVKLKDRRVGKGDIVWEENPRDQTAQAVLIVELTNSTGEPYEKWVARVRNLSYKGI